jgi:hypothetical protein
MRHSCFKYDGDVGNPPSSYLHFLLGLYSSIIINMVQVLSSVLVLFVTLLSASVYAKAIFGAEFTFTNQSILVAQTFRHVTNNPISERFRDILAEKILRECDGCLGSEGTDRYGNKTYKIVYPDGFYIVVSTDPGVVEVQTKPLTVEEWVRQKDRLQKDLFDAATSLGIPPGQVGGGHIHMGLEGSVGSNLFLMRNLLVDFANHPELSLGVLHYDIRNAPPISALPEGQREAFAKIIAEVDSGQIDSPAGLARRIYYSVYGGPDFQKMNALNLSRIVESIWSESERTFEFRGIRPERNVEEFIILIRILEGRLSYLKTMKTPIPLAIPQFGNNQKTVKMKIENFVDYLLGTGVNLEEFVSGFSLMGPYKRAAEAWIKNTKQANLCTRLFAHLSE